MKRLTDKHKNSSFEYDRIYEERKKKGPDAYDMKRWGRLIRYFQHGNLVDLGCLDSEIVDLIYKRPDTSYTGIDIAENAIHAQRLKYKEFKNVYFVPGDIYETPFQDEAFDYAILGEVIEHLEEPQKAIEEAVRILRPGGILAVSVPLNEAREPGAVDRERHIWSFTEEDMHVLLDQYGTVNLSKMGSQYFPQYVYRWPTLFAFLSKK